MGSIEGKSQQQRWRGVGVEIKGGHLQHSAGFPGCWILQAVNLGSFLITKFSFKELFPLLFSPLSAFLGEPYNADLKLNKHTSETSQGHLM